MQKSKRRAAFASAIVTVAVLSHASIARAAAPSCASLDVSTTSDIAARWPGIDEDVRTAFAARDNVDRCAKVKLLADRNAIVAEVTLPDGRSASRSLVRREDVVPALEGLLLVPADSPPSDGDANVARDVPAAPVARSTAPTRTLSLAALRYSSDRDAPSPSATSSVPPSHLRIELSVLTGARFGDGQTGVGVGAQSFLDAAGWLVGFGARVDRYWGTQNADGNAAALEVAVLGGRRTWLARSLAFDLFVGPGVTFDGESSYEIHTTHGIESGSSSGLLPRFLLGTRLTFGARSIFRTFVGIDGEMGPSRRGDDVPDAPRLPIWTLGLALGATVGSP